MSQSIATRKLCVRGYDQAINGIKVNFDAIAKKAMIDGVNLMRLNNGNGANGKHPDPEPADPDDE